MRLVVLLTTAFILLWTSSVASYSKRLTPQQISQAIEYGKSRRGVDLVQRDHPNFTPIWSTALTGGQSGFAIVITPWMQVASAARDAAGQYRDLSSTEVGGVLAQANGQLEFWAAIVSSVDGFWRDAHAVLRQSGRTIQPISVRGSLLRVVSCRGGCTYSGWFTIVFPDAQLDSAGEAEFLLIIQGGRFEYRAIINLARLDTVIHPSATPSATPTPVTQPTSPSTGAGEGKESTPGASPSPVPTENPAPTPAPTPTPSP